MIMCRTRENEHIQQRIAIGTISTVFIICNIHAFNVCATCIYVPAIRGRDCVRKDPKEFSDSCSRTTSVCP